MKEEDIVGADGEDRSGPGNEPEEGEKPKKTKEPPSPPPWPPHPVPEPIPEGPDRPPKGDKFVPKNYRNSLANYNVKNRRFFTLYSILT